ncbi:aspartate aminotransferase family protein [Actinomadura sp. HBU206391]|uniref:aspartate aminotransferase family protein n=1 Tax=Actinomadura sp. HBU206391 TaxID=2731692 RepID=UPI00164F2A09|nr:aspartate aminotransferase family protein [Actinomadura sp. HBU206391]MBC6458484.1 aspartate aminotransferase family protein [Actinomadura sp. HBU206391]
MDPRASLLIRPAGEFAPDVIARASGSWLETVDGRRVLDFTSGQICATIGHNHPRIAEAIRRSLDDVSHLNSRLLSEPVLALAERLADLMPAGLDRSLFLSTGGEVNEAAVRMAKLATGGFEVVGLTHSWHGMTSGSQAVTFSAGRRGHGPTAPGIFALPAPYAYRCPVRHCAGTCDQTCLEVGFELYDQQSVGAPAAVIAEPVLSAGGVLVPPPGYFSRLIELAHERGMLFILDEAQTGFGRLGAMFGMDVYDIVPDFVTLSKTLGGGIPVGAVGTTAEIEQAAYDRGFMYLTSHQADPLPAAAALAVLDVVAEEDLVRRAAARGERLGRHLRELCERHEVIGDVRGMGLLWGVELVADRDTRRPALEFGDAVTDACHGCGLSLNITRGRSGGATACLRIAPPLTVTDDEIDTAAEILDQALTSTPAPS